MHMIDIFTKIFIAPALYADVKEAWNADLDHNQIQIPLEEIKVPTLVVHGKYDKLVPVSHAEGTAARIPNCELHIKPEGTHVSALDPGFEELLDKWFEFIKKN